MLLLFQFVDVFYPFSKFSFGAFLSIFQADEQCGGETRDKGRIEKGYFQTQIKKVKLKDIFQLNIKYFNS